MDRFADMQMYVSVAESGSISAAAERLNLAKSAVSRRLAELGGSEKSLQSIRRRRG